MKNLLKQLEEKKLRLDQYRPLPISLVKNLTEWFKIELTYTSNAIEGNTLSRAETALVVEKGLTVAGKTLVEHLEAVNHAEAFDWLLRQVTEPHYSVSEITFLDVHQRILQRIDDLNAGRYRTVPVRIAGSTVIMPNPVKVPQLMEEFAHWLSTNSAHAVHSAIEAHYKFVSIHPFVDGNGRTARLLMNFLLMKAGYPPAIIQKEERSAYIKSIEKAQLGGSLNDYYALMYSAVDRSLDIYLDAVEQKEQHKILEKKPLLKISEVAKLANESIATVRYWTKEDLLKVEEYSPGGYQLYTKEQVAVSKKIRKLQNTKRLTLAEIRRLI